jgi:hypothetical protein
MSFWDRFIWALYFGLAQHLPVGRDAALRILDLAVARGRLALPGLNHTSLLLLLALLPDDSPHREDVVTLALSAGVDQHPVRISHLLQAAVPHRLNEFVEIYRLSGPDLRAVALHALLAPNELGLLEDLALYLARRFLINPTNPDLLALVTGLIAEATQRYARIPLGTVDYLTWLYRVVGWRTQPGEPLPDISPPSLEPAWFQVLTEAEQRFVEVCANVLEETAKDLLCLHFYALLTVEQIVAAWELDSEQGPPRSFRGWKSAGPWSCDLQPGQPKSCVRQKIRPRARIHPDE